MNSGTLLRSEARHPAWLPYLQLMRPANMLTSLADALAGASVAIAIARPDTIGQLILLASASSFLYAGGVVLNDLVDYRTDALKRPLRPLPSGRASWMRASLLVFVLMCGGIGLAAMAGPTSAWLATLIASAAVLYNGAFKNHPLGGPLLLGLCRGLNLLLGMSLSAAVLRAWWPLMLVPVLYVGAVAVISQGRTHGIRHAAWSANALLLAVTASLLLLGMEREYQLMMALPFIAFLAWRVWPLFLRAALVPNTPRIRHAVQVGSLSLICLDAAIAGGFGGLVPGLLVLMLMPLSIRLRKSFAAT